MKVYVIINAIMEKSIVLNGKEAGKPMKSSSLSKKKNDAKKVSSAGAKTEKKSVPQLKTKNKVVRRIILSYTFSRIRV